MSVETELKLHIAPEHLGRLRRHPLLRTLSTARSATHKLYNVYYDTPDLALHGQAMALRLRRIGRQWRQTLKGGGGVHAGLHQRDEWETPLKSGVLDLGALEASGAPALAPALRKKLQPLFATDFSRTTYLLGFNGAGIELCLDSGAITAGRASRAISEVELELKWGEPAQLFELAQTLLDIVPLSVEHTSKAEYGYRLVTGAAPEIAKARAPDLSECTAVPGALQAMIVSCLFHLQANVPGAVQKLDEEYLHQVRVALRRLRAVLAMTESFHADGELGKLHEQVAELCVELGVMREWDVFVTQIVEPLRERLPEPAGRRMLRACEKLRGQRHAIVESRLQSQDYQRFLLRFGAWMHGEYWSRPSAHDLSLRDFAVRILDKRQRQVDKRGKHLAKATPDQLHMLRIACKKLRYSAEMFAPLFEMRRAKPHLSALAALQDSLGRLNDLVVAQRLLDEMDARGLQETIAFVREEIDLDYRKILARLLGNWKKFSGVKAFWNRPANRR